MANRESNYVIRLKVDGTVRVTKDFDHVGDQGEKAFKRVRRSASKTNSAIRGVARNITSTLVPAFAAAASASSIFRNIQTFEKLDIRLRSLTSSAEDYASTQEFLKAKADELNVGIETLTDGYARLLVLQNSGILNREQVNQLSEGLVNAAAQLGASGADIDRVLFGLSQGLSSGTLRAEELNQVVEPLPGLLQALDSAAGLTAGGFRRMVNEGKVTSEFFATTLVKALEQYEGAAAKLDGTVSGSLAKLNNAWVELARTIGESGIIDFITELTEGMAVGIGVATKAAQGQYAFAEATTFVEKTAFVAGRAIKVFYLSLQGAIVSVALAVVDGLNAAYKGAVAVANLIPGVEVKAMEGLTRLSDTLRATVKYNVEEVYKSLTDFGPDKAIIENIRKLQAEQTRLQREAEIARSKAAQERAKQERENSKELTKEEKAAIKRLEDQRKKIEQVTQALKFRNEQLMRDEQTQEIYNQIKAAGVELLSREGQEISALVKEYYRLKEAKEQEAEVEERKKQLIEEIKQITEENISAQDKYNERMEELNELLKEGAINYEEFQAAGEKAHKELLEASDKWYDGAVRALDKYAEEATDMAANVERVVTNLMQNLEDSLVEAAMTGKFEFKDLVDSLIEDITRLIIRTQILGPLAQSLSQGIQSAFGGSSGGGGGGFFSSISSFFGGLFEDGAAFQRGQRVTAYARGGIVNKPTLFPMAKGMGLMGEAGPEAVLPLTRTSSGRLGVDATGKMGGSFYTLNIDARGSSDPAATRASVKQAVDEALNARIPGIIKTSTEMAHRRTVDSWQRRGSRFE